MGGVGQVPSRDSVPEFASTTIVQPDVLPEIDADPWFGGGGMLTNTVPTASAYVGVEGTRFVGSIVNWNVSWTSACDGLTSVASTIHWTRVGPGAASSE